MTTDIPLDDVLRHIDLALDGMCATLERLGDDLVNERPDLPGANSPFVIVRHCCGVIEYWGALALAGRTTDRDRDAEFVASGTVAELLALVAQQRDQLHRDLADFDGSAASVAQLRRHLYTPQELAAVATKGGVLMHVYEELAQHRGHLDITADILLAR
jgi:hypothetical protein